MEKLAALSLPDAVKRTLQSIIESAQRALGDKLHSIVLFGSAAEGRLRNTSDVNVLFVLRSYEAERLAAIRDELRQGRAAINLQVMFLLESELETAALAFTVKFLDIKKRHVVLFGPDVVSDLQVPRSALINRLRQVLLNEMLRLRAAFVYQGSRSEQISKVIADAAGPLRACAAALIELEGSGAVAPKEALAKLATAIPGFPSEQVLEGITRTRGAPDLPAGEAAELLSQLIELAQRLQERVKALST